jgi:hypothetical protein
MRGGFEPRPSHTLYGAPIWQRGDVESFANSYWSGRSEGMVFLHPKTWATAEGAARELIFYKGIGARVHENQEGVFTIHVPIGPRPARTLRMMQRFGNFDWQIRRFDPRPSS